MESVQNKLESLRREVGQFEAEITARQQYIQRALGAIQVLEQLIKEEGDEIVNNHIGWPEQVETPDSQGSET